MVLDIFSNIFVIIYFLYYNPYTSKIWQELYFPDYDIVNLFENKILAKKIWRKNEIGNFSTTHSL